MNSFGTLFRVQIFGESHGPAIGVVIDGCPVGIPIGADDFTSEHPSQKSRRFGNHYED
jgi:chorismate synthase